MVVEVVGVLEVESVKGGVDGEVGDSGCRGSGALVVESDVGVGVGFGV